MNSENRTECPLLMATVCGFMKYDVFHSVPNSVRELTRAAANGFET